MKNSFDFDWKEKFKEPTLSHDDMQSSHWNGWHWHDRKLLKQTLENGHFPLLTLYLGELIGKRAEKEQRTFNDFFFSFLIITKLAKMDI
jgi:hypothetical protein